MSLRFPIHIKRMIIPPVNMHICHWLAQDFPNLFDHYTYLTMEKEEANVSGTFGPHRSRKWKSPKHTRSVVCRSWRASWESTLIYWGVCGDVDMGLFILDTEVLSPRHRGWVRMSQ